MATPNFSSLAAVAVADPHEPENAIKPNADGSINVDITGVIPPVGAAHIATNQITVASTATLIAAARATRSDIAIVNDSTVDVYIGDSGVTTGNGVLLVGIKGAAVTIDTNAAVYGIVATGTESVSYVETYT